MLVSLTSAAQAHARPSFALQQSSAHAGEAVRFSISDVDGWGVAYHLEIGDDDLLDGRSAGSVAGTFTMPDLGDAAKTVVVDASLWWSDRKGTVRSSLEYLGPAPAATPASPAPAPSAPAVPQAGPAPQQPSAVQNLSPAQARTPKGHRRPRPAPRTHAAETHRSPAPRARHHRRSRRESRVRHRRAKHGARLPRWAFEGDPYGRTGAPVPGHDFSALGSIVPYGAAVAASRARTGLAASVAVPGLLALAALTLAGTAALRQQRLTARARRG